MKRISAMAITLFVSALFVAPAMASDTDPTPNKAQKKEQRQTAGKVSKAQIDAMNKRKEAKKQRDEKLKIRNENVNKSN